MKHSLSGLALLAILFTPTFSAPLERGHGVLHRLSPHRGLSRQIQAASAKRPLNLTFSPIRPGDVPVHVEYGASTQLQTSDFSFSASLLKLVLDDDIVDAEWRDTQVAFRSVDTYGGRQVVISTCMYPFSITFGCGRSTCVVVYFQLTQWSGPSNKRGYRKRICPNTSARMCMSLTPTQAINTNWFRTAIEKNLDLLILVLS